MNDLVVVVDNLVCLNTEVTLVTTWINSVIGAILKCWYIFDQDVSISF